jgi:hypothetical protein
MYLRVIPASVCFSVFGALMFGTLSANTAVSTPARLAQDDRAADREAIRAHIDKIFRAFAERDCVTIRATHAENWIGFTSGSRSIEKGVDNHMKGTARFCQGGPDDLGDGERRLVSGYRMSEIDYVFWRRGSGAIYCRINLRQSSAS